MVRSSKDYGPSAYGCRGMGPHGLQNEGTPVAERRTGFSSIYRHPTDLETTLDRVGLCDVIKGL